MKGKMEEEKEVIKAKGLFIWSDGALSRYTEGLHGRRLSYICVWDRSEG